MCLGLLPGTAFADESDLPDYIELRDLAHVLNGTKAQFSVGYSKETGITVTSGQAYQDNGSEMNTPFSGDRAYTGGGQSVQINGKAVEMTAINLLDDQGGGYNYFKLRDLAYVLSGTDKQFEVGWDAAARAISLTSGAAYTAVGGEMTGQSGGAQAAKPSAAKILLDGEEISLTAYEIGGNNYFKLRDIGQTFDFGINWDGGSRTITIDTSVPYTAE